MAWYNVCLLYTSIMSKNPRHKNENIIKKQDTVRILYVAMLIASLGLGVNQHLLSVGVNHNRCV